MECSDCGQVADWVGEGGFDRVGEAATRPLVECAECGTRQHAR